ncbi:hypothetical protein AB0C52_21350 [Streptomyces sp. NPDC048717]|uniref:hypothetical protein n=1 Tax=Streptomyces sp. NPDC048717 TaxID=3154928 RepID=UPI00343F8CD6
MDGEALLAALDAEPVRFGEHGIDAAVTLVVFDASAESVLVESPTGRRGTWWSSAAGSSGRKPLLPLFEQMVNLIHRHSPQAAVAFNTTITDGGEAAPRRL